MKIYTVLQIVCFLTTAIFSQINFTTHIITPGAGITDNATDVLTFDVNDDGHTDIVSSSFLDGKVAWYENDGQQNYIQHIITTNAAGASKLDMVDMDGDGDIDILSDASIDDKIFWYENDGQGNFNPHVIYSNENSPFEWATYSVAAKDVDSDGDMDALHCGWSDTVLRWHENNGSDTSFTTQIVDTVGERCQIIAEDLDQDADTDIIVTSQIPSKIIWYENDGQQNFIKHIIWEGNSLPRIIIAIDLEADGDLDLLASHYNDNVAWYENDGQQNFTSHPIQNSPTCNTIFVVDLDSDTDLDIIVGDPDNNWNNSRVGWLENDGFLNFTYHNITYELLWPSAVWADDVDSDGDLDILFSSLYDDKVAWCESDLISPVGISETAEIPSGFALAQNYPNPFNPSTTIRYDIAIATPVRLEIFDLLGQRIKILIKETKQPGGYSVIWNGRNALGEPVPSGVYIYRLQAGDFQQSRKLILLR